MNRLAPRLHDWQPSLIWPHGLAFKTMAALVFLRGLHWFLFFCFFYQKCISFWNCCDHSIERLSETEGLHKLWLGGSCSKTSIFIYVSRRLKNQLILCAVYISVRVHPWPNSSEQKRIWSARPSRQRRASTASSVLRLWHAWTNSSLPTNPAPTAASPRDSCTSPARRSCSPRHWARTNPGAATSCEDYWLPAGKVRTSEARRYRLGS